MLESYCVRLLVLILVSSTVANAAEFDVDSLQQRVYSTIKNVQPAVVSIGQRGGSFSGVIVSKAGHVLSAGHTVRPGGRYRIFLSDGRQLSARGKGSNPQADCALLQITSDVDDLPFVQMGESASLVRNQPCLSISFPAGQRARGVPVVRFGRIVQTGRGRRLLQSTALMEPGDSGGPLFDLQGRVIGIHSRIGQSMTRNYEVPIDTFRRFWSELNLEHSFTRSGPPVPRLGFRGMDRRDGTGIDVEDIIDGSLAEVHGISPGDIIQTVYSRKTPSIRELRDALIAARDEDAEEVVVEARREGEEIELRVPFDVQRESAPKVELPAYGRNEFRKPTAIDQLVDLPAEFSDLESVLDDACVEISSKLSDGEALSIGGTLLKATPYIVSKNSMVGQNPSTTVAGSFVELEVLKRDRENDLVLLQAPVQHSMGIDITSDDGEVPRIGNFLITPESAGPGLISVMSTKPFASRKQQSRGFLGVVPTDYENRGGAVLQEVTKDGAAERAGLDVGDVIIKLNDTSIATHMEMRRFLGTCDPNAIVLATIIRGNEEMEKTIRLGSFPSFSNHAADQMNKSGRRDGFSKVIPHDADLNPANCGGPIFDLNGNFVGLNIARNSRVRSYAIPRSIIKQLIETN